MKTSIIYPSFCKTELLKITLNRLAQVPKSSEIEVIIVNDGIEDGTFEIVDRCGLPYKYYYTGQRNSSGLISRNPGFVINYGVKHSDSDYIIITGPDVYLVNDDSLIRTISILNKNSKALAVPKDILDDQGIAKEYLSNGKNIELILETLIINKPTGPFVANPYMPYWMGMHRNEFEIIGGYDEDLTGICSDDNDLVDRLQWNGCSYEFGDFLAIHLYHSKPDPDSVFSNPEYHKNIKIRQEKGRTIVRNVGRDWGK